MKINEIENLLGLTRANIRFYEKEGLLTPERKENGYREYSEEDIAILKKIIIFRKLGLSLPAAGMTASQRMDLFCNVLFTPKNIHGTKLTITP